MATIRPRGDAWEAQIRRKGWPTVSRTFSTKADAQSWASVVESEMVRGVFVDRKEAQKKTMGDLFKQYLEDVSPQKKDGHTEGYRLNALMKDPLAKIVVADLSGKVMAQWRDRRLKEVTGSTTNRDLNLISHVINVARREWGIHVDNTPLRCELGHLTASSNPWVRLLVIVVIETAMRRSELLAWRAGSMSS